MFGLNRRQGESRKISPRIQNAKIHEWNAEWRLMRGKYFDEVLEEAELAAILGS